MPRMAPRIVNAEAKGDHWRNRRRVMYLALVYVGIHLSWITFRSPDDALHEQLAVALTAAGSAIIGSYVFGAIWDDKNRRNFIARVDGKEGENDV